jgi:hypothetical protein
VCVGGGGGEKKTAVPNAILVFIAAIMKYVASYYVLLYAS